MTYVALSNHPKEKGRDIKTALVKIGNIDNPNTYERIGVITPEGTEDKDVIIFPEPINGKYVMIHRPHNWRKKDILKADGKIYVKKEDRYVEWLLDELPDYFPEKPSMWICYSYDMKKWFNHKLLAEPAYWWEELKIGAGTQPIKTEYGWLLIYHGVSNNDGRKYYRAGAMLLDINNPERIIARTREPVLEPEYDFEINGITNFVVFPEGAIVKDKKLFVYYGCADKYVGVATICLNEFLEWLIEENSIVSQ